MFTTPFDDLTIAELKEEGDWPGEWNPAKGLAPYVRRLGPDIVCVMIGIDKGETAYYLLENCPNIRAFMGIDPYLERPTWNNSVIVQERMDKIKEIALKNLEEFDTKIMIKETKDGIVPRTADFVYVDGQTYEQTKADYQQMYPVVRSGGIFAGSNHNTGAVQKALKEFRDENKVRIPIHLTDNNTFFWSVP
jgi:hypothetical protein